MAKNWTMKEALEAVVTGNKEGLQDLGRRFPLTAVALAKGDFTTIINALPDHITARKIESVLKDGIQESVEDDENVEVEEEVVEEKPAKAKKEKAAKKPAKDEPVEEEEDDETSDEIDYSSMNAVELFKLCKKRGIKVESKQKAAVYVKALKAADEATNEENDDDWEEEEEEKPAKKATKEAKSKQSKKPAKKEDAVDADADDEDDDDWDI